MSRAILLISHGSRSDTTKDEIKFLIGRLKKKNDKLIYHYAFLELESPDIPEGVDQCIQAGAKDILVVLNFLNSGQHVDRDIPAIIEGCREKHPHVNIKISTPIGQHPGIVELFTNLIESS